MSSRENICRSGRLRSSVSIIVRLLMYSPMIIESWAIICAGMLDVVPTESGVAFSAPPIAGRRAKRASVT